jgi:membrane-bound serine protease (ClpP class)
MQGEEGSAITDIHAEGKVLIHGEQWNAMSDVPVTRGGRIRVIRVEGLKVKVEPINK